MKFEKKWVHALALAISYPSLILITAFGFHVLIEGEILSPILGWGIFVFILISFVIILIKDAFNPKK